MAKTGSNTNKKTKSTTNKARKHANKKIDEDSDSLSSIEKTPVKTPINLIENDLYNDDSELEICSKLTNSKTATFVGLTKKLRLKELKTKLEFIGEVQTAEYYAQTTKKEVYILVVTFL
eukprot:GAHX01000753.1.p1 GENE.GAHX01000753.1~~GAHX01000753.1.p1  ORF type:complete len:131 (-),score=34.66 GAHX01000753.1:28-384(-)